MLTAGASRRLLCKLICCAAICSLPTRKILLDFYLLLGYCVLAKIHIMQRRNEYEGKKNLALVAAGIVIGAFLAFPTAHAAEELFTAVRSSHQFFLDGEKVQMEAYIINGNNYVKLADVGKMVGFNVYWDGAVYMDSDAPYTGKAPEASSTLEEVREEIAVLVNEVRRENGLQELTIDQRLMAAAQNCSDQKFTWHHTKEECEAVAASGYPYGFGSNLTVFTGAAIADIAQRAVDNWEKSPGHFQTMTDPDATSLGVGVTKDNGVTYCYLFLGKPNTNNPYG